MTNDAGTEIRAAGSDSSKLTPPTIDEIKAAQGNEQFRLIYWYLLLLKPGEHRTTLTVSKEYADLINLIAQSAGVSTNEALAHLLLSAAERGTDSGEATIESLLDSLKALQKSVAGLGDQLDGVTDAALIGAYGNLGAADTPPDGYAQSLPKELEQLEDDAGIPSEKGEGDDE